MGAAASVRMLYKDAMGWFKQYIDTETYMVDFKSMDRHNENALSFADVQYWISMKGKTDPIWGIFLTSGPVLTIAHKYACKHGDTHTSVSASKMVNVTEFKTLLVHLFAFSILWSHFANAEKWEVNGADLVGHRLNFEAFKLACRTFDSANAHEDLNDSQIKTDFELIDSNFSGSVGFIEVCNHCCKFIDDPDVEKKLPIVVPKFFGDFSHTPSDTLLQTLIAGPKSYFEVASIDQKNHELVQALVDKLAAQSDNLKSAAALEHQNNIRKKYSSINEIISHPTCFGFLLQFCRSQHSDENLSFIRDVDEFRDLFIGDNKVWSKQWREIDEVIGMNVCIDEGAVCDEEWTSDISRATALSYCEAICEKYLHDSSPSQVCLSSESVRRTHRRMKLISQYGPCVFDEACIDPILTMDRDVLPRLRVSPYAASMISRVASSEPPPVALDLRPPPPENLLLNLCVIESFPDTRMFSLDEVIGCRDLYLSFLAYLKGTDVKSKGAAGSDFLLCVRKIDIFEDLIRMNCLPEATEEAWEIFRFYGAAGSAFEVPITGLDRKRLMLIMAEPKRGMFREIRQTAYSALQKHFALFRKTEGYRMFPNLMRALKAEMSSTKSAKTFCEVSPSSRRTLNFKYESTPSPKSVKLVKMAVSEGIKSSLNIKSPLNIKSSLNIKSTTRSQMVKE